MNNKQILVSEKDSKNKGRKMFSKSDSTMLISVENLSLLKSNIDLKNAKTLKEADNSYHQIGTKEYEEAVDEVLSELHKGNFRVLEQGIKKTNNEIYAITTLIVLEKSGKRFVIISIADYNFFNKTSEEIIKEFDLDNHELKTRQEILKHSDKGLIIDSISITEIGEFINASKMYKDTLKVVDLISIPYKKRAIEEMEKKEKLYNEFQA